MDPSAPRRSVTPVNRHLAQVAEVVRSSIAASPGEEAFRALLAELMTRPGRVLAAPERAKWPTFVGSTCDALGGDRRAAVIAAAAVEFAAAAIDVADDLIDDEWPGGTAARNRALNAALALSWLAQGCVTRLTDHLDPARVGQVALLLAGGSLGSCAGQDLDLALEGRSDVEEETALAMTRGKSGSLVAMACKVGAAVATSDAAILDIIDRFGNHVGVVAQLLNDLVDVDPEAERGSDLRRGKRTLPIAFGLRCADEADAAPILRRYREGELLGSPEEAELVAVLRDLGALHYTWLVAEAHRREALALLPDLARCVGGERVGRLRRLVPLVRMRTLAGGGARCAPSESGGSLSSRPAAGASRRRRSSPWLPSPASV